MFSPIRPVVGYPSSSEADIDPRCTHVLRPTEQRNVAPVAEPAVAIPAESSAQLLVLPFGIELDSVLRIFGHFFIVLMAQR